VSGGEHENDPSGLAMKAFEFGPRLPIWFSPFRLTPHGKQWKAFFYFGKNGKNPFGALSVLFQSS
jgi:hypothetical protein